MNGQEFIDATAGRSGEKAATADLLSAMPEIVGFDPFSRGEGRAHWQQPGNGRRNQDSRREDPET